MQTLSQTVVSQYQNSPVIDELVELFSQAIGPDALYDAFYINIWNVLSEAEIANALPNYGFDIWGRIVGVSRIVTGGVGSYFGFGEATDRTGFNQSPFYNGQAITENYILTNQAFLLLILAKAAANITSGSIASMNQILLNLFPNRGKCYVVDGQNMTMTYVFNFFLQPFEIAVTAVIGAFLTPTGVAASFDYAGN